MNATGREVMQALAVLAVFFVGVWLLWVVLG